MSSKLNKDSIIKIIKEVIKKKSFNQVVETLIRFVKISLLAFAPYYNPFPHKAAVYLTIYLQGL